MTPPLEPFTVGTHNLHDEAGRPTFFADLILFTEAIPHEIAEAEGKRFDTGRLRRLTITERARRAAAFTGGRLRGFAFITDRRQPDLVIAYRRRLFARRGKTYTHVIDGVPKVTPDRGTLVGLLDQRATGVQVAAVCEHRINAWYPPFVRGEPKFRKEAWLDHTRATVEIIRQLEGSGYRVAAGGDTNTPHGFTAYAGTGLREVGERLDRLASRRIGDPEELSRMGSDHWRLRATVRP